MKINSIIDYLLCFLVFVFWAILYPYHTLFTEQSSLFLYTSDYWGQYALRPEGWAMYCGNFLAQFYIDRWAGALIQTLLFATLLVVTKRILIKIGVKGNILPVATLPALLWLALQCDHRFTPGDALSFICPFALTLLYMSMSNTLLRRLLFTLMIIPVYLFSGAAATCSLYVACTLFELFYAKDAWRFCTPLWPVAATFLPYLWQKVYLQPSDGLFEILTYPLVDGIKYVPYLLLVFVPFCILMVKIIGTNRLSAIAAGKTVFAINILALLGYGYYLFSKTYHRTEEQKFGMSVATIRYDWDKVLKISEGVKNPDQHTAYFANLALAMKGDLSQKMFQYPQTDEYGLFLVHSGDHFNLSHGSEFYSHIGILNEAIRWIFDAYILRQKGMDYHTLVRLAVWNRDNGYDRVARKYFDILECTLMYRSWSKRQRKAPVVEKKKDPVQPIEFYIGGREPISDMARYYDNNPQNRLALDYMSCCLLLKNDPVKFLKLYDACYPPSPERIPQAYQEVLLVMANMGKINISNFPIDKINEIRFRSFNDLVSKGNGKELEKQFGDTWWYYSYKKRQ